MKNATRKKKEKKLMELTKRATDQSSDGILITNAKLDEDKAKIVYTNKSFCKMTGYTYADLVGKPLNLLHGPKTDPKTLALRRTFLSQGKSFTGKVIKYRKDGSEFYSECDSAPVFDGKSKITHFIYILRDVSKQVLAEINKEEIMGTVSQELKNPLTSINGFVDILRNHIGEDDSDKKFNYLTKIKTEVDRLVGLTNEILEINQQKPNGVILIKEPLDIDEIIRKIIKKIRGTINSHKIKRRGRVGELVTCDKERIVHVITHLIKNAINYSPDAEQIIVLIKRENNHAIISIQDFGIGISNDKQEKIFEFDNNSMAKNKSVSPGLGLHIAAGIVRNHGGNMWVESTEGKGSTFSFNLPISEDK